MGDLTGLGDALDWEVQSDQTNPSLRTEDCDRIAALMADPAVPAGAIGDQFKAAFFDTKKPDRGRTVEVSAGLRRFSRGRTAPSRNDSAMTTAPRTCPRR